MLLAPLALAACGGGNGTVAITDLGPSVETASCAHEVRCGVYADEATCEPAADDFSSSPAFRSALSASTVPNPVFGL